MRSAACSGVFGCEDAEDYGFLGIVGNSEKSLRSGVCDVFVVVGFASDDGSDGDYGIG